MATHFLTDAQREFHESVRRFAEGRIAPLAVGVELRSPARDIAVDAHPGFRDVARRGLGRCGATIVTGVSDESAGAPAADPALVVVGRDPRSPDGDAGVWEAPELPLRIDDYLGDAYEPGRLTATVYEAVARAAALDGPARHAPGD